MLYILKTPIKFGVVLQGFSEYQNPDQDLTLNSNIKTRFYT